MYHRIQITVALGEAGSSYQYSYDYVLAVFCEVLHEVGV